MPPLPLTRTPNTPQQDKGVKRAAAASAEPSRAFTAGSQIGIEVDEGSAGGGGGGGQLAAEIWPGEEEEEEDDGGVSSALAMQQFAQMQKRKRKGK
jgi:hypothetical protein